MIQPTELRIGNCFADLGKYYKATSRDLDNYDRQTGMTPYNPIPLTEEWLMKVGFVKINTSSDQFGVFEYHHAGTMFMGRWCNGLFHWNGLDIKLPYLHQLQNLYFALTGEELKIEI